MALINHNINNLSGGVSRQPDESRFDTQVEEMTNFEPFVTGDIRRRNPLKLFGNVANFTDNMAVHVYNRGDGLEKYGMILNDNGLKVYAVEGGGSKTVTIKGATNPLTAWAGTDWSKDIEFLTVGDTTWMLNKAKVVATTGNITPALGSSYKAFYWIKRSFDDGSSGGYTYYVTINGTTYSTNNISSDTAATNLASQINAVSGLTSRAEGSVVYIVSTSAFTFSGSDSWGDQASVGWRSSVSKIENLPSDMDGFTTAEVGTIEVTGTDRNNFTSYYLSWTINDEGDGYWKETVDEGIEDTLDLTTLPAKIVRLSDGSFGFGFNENLESEGFYTEWNKRLKGDDDSNPMPSFVGYTISNMFFFRNRLGLTSEENVILSEVSSYYNFFATTVIEVLDGDTIDVSVDSDSVAIIRNVNGVAGSLTLWADDSQYVLSGGDILSPATTRVSKTSSYSCDNTIAPVVLDNEIIFFNKIDNNLEVSSYSASSLNTDKSSAESISTNVLGYLPSTVNTAVVASASNMLFLLDEAQTNSVYVYKYHVKGNEKIMSSWFKWTFDHVIKDIKVLDNVLYLLVDDNTVTQLELSITDLDETFLDLGITTYVSEVILSKFNVETKQGTRNIREPFYVKNLKVSYLGTCDLDIINSERNKTKTIKNKHLNRKLFIGGNSEKVTLSFKSDYDTGCKINTLSLEGLVKIRSKNV